MVESVLMESVLVEDVLVESILVESVRTNPGSKREEKCDGWWMMQRL